MTYPTDKEIVKLAKSKNATNENKAVKWIYLKYGTRVYIAISYQLYGSHFSDHDVEEVHGDFFCKLADSKSSHFQNLKGFVPSFEGALGVWLAKSAQNDAKDYYKRWKRRNEKTIPVDTNEPNDQHQGGNYLESIPDVDTTNQPYLMIFGQAVFESMQELPDEKRDVLLLRSIGCTHPEIAKELNISVSTSKTRLKRARKDLDVHLINEGYLEEDDRYSIFPLWWVFRRNIQEHAHQTLYDKTIDNSETTQLGEFIREKRYERSVSRYELGQKTGLEQDQLAALENGRIIKTDIKQEWLNAIAEALSIPSSSFGELLKRNAQSSLNSEKTILRPLATEQSKSTSRLRKLIKSTVRLAIIGAITLALFINRQKIAEFANAQAPGLERQLSELPFFSTAPQDPLANINQEVIDPSTVELVPTCAVGAGNPYLRTGPGGEGYYDLVGSEVALTTGTDAMVIGQSPDNFIEVWYFVEGKNHFTDELAQGWIPSTSCKLEAVTKPISTLVPTLPNTPVPNPEPTVQLWQEGNMIHWNISNLAYSEATLSAVSNFAHMGIVLQPQNLTTAKGSMQIKSGYTCSTYTLAVRPMGSDMIVLNQEVCDSSIELEELELINLWIDNGNVHWQINVEYSEAYLSARNITFNAQHLEPIAINSTGRYPMSNYESELSPSCANTYMLTVTTVDGQTLIATIDSYADGQCLTSP